jgi:hypothetical protein
MSLLRDVIISDHYFFDSGVTMHFFLNPNHGNILECEYMKYMELNERMLNLIEMLDHVRLPTPGRSCSVIKLFYSVWYQEPIIKIF